MLTRQSCASPASYGQLWSHATCSLANDRVQGRLPLCQSYRADACLAFMLPSLMPVAAPALQAEATHLGMLGEDLMDPWKRQGRAAPRPQTTRNPGAVPYDGTVVFLQGTAPWLTAGDTRRLAQLTRGMAGSPLSKQHRIASQRSSKTHHSVCSALLCDIPIGIPSQDDD